MDWEELAINELHHRFEAIQRCIEKIVFPGLSGVLPEHGSTWPTLDSGIAYLTGGVDRFGAPIIYLPYNQNLINYNKSDFQGVIQYLAAVTKAPAADVGFVILIDRRRDRWSSLGFALQNVASCFPGDLRMIFALRPSSIFQGALSSIAMRWQKEEYNYKVPIELLSSLDVLLPWIDREELPLEIGGIQEYDHAAWLVKRKLIENLASSLKCIIQHCKSYSLDLINAQFPNEENCDEIVQDQDEESNFVLKKFDSLAEDGKKNLQDEIWNQESLNEGVVNASITDIKHLCSLILEVKDAFSDFWEKYASKRTEYLKLRSFEKDYKAASLHLSRLIQGLEEEMKKKEKLVLAGEDNYIRETIDMEHTNLELCLRACSTGQYLIDEHPHAIDCIKPKCDELKRLSGCFYLLKTEKQKQDNLFAQVRKDLREVTDWCSRGMNLLAKQDLHDLRTPGGLNIALKELTSFMSTYRTLNINDRRHLLSGPKADRKFDAMLEPLTEAISKVDDVLDLFERRKSCLQSFPSPQEKQDSTNESTDSSKVIKIETEKTEEEQHFLCFPQRISTPESSKDNTAIVHPILHSEISPVNDDTHKLRHVIKELIETEKKYVDELDEIVQGYGEAIEDESMITFVPPELKGNKALLLGNLEDILRFHQKYLLPEIILCENNASSISDLFVQRKENFMLYCDYCHNSHRSKSFRKEIGENHPFFIECQRRLSHRLPLSAYLLKPVQRITKYQLLLQQMQKYSTEVTTKSIEKAVETMMEVLKHLNDSMHQTAIRGFKEEFSTLGNLRMQGSFQVQVEYKRSKVKELARSKFNKALLRHLFLYENALLICKRCQATEGCDVRGSEKGNSYQFKRCMKTNLLSVAEVVKGYPTKFKLSARGDEGELTVTATSVSIKQSWIKELQGCISRQRRSLGASNSPTRVQMRKKKTSEVATQKASAVDVRRKKVQRSKTLPACKATVLENRYLHEEVEKTRVLKNKQTVRSKIKIERKENISEVNFGNIHGVEKSPKNISGSAGVHQEQLCRQISDTHFYRSFRGKKKVPK